MRWRKQGGGKTRTGKERIKEPDEASMKRKLKFLEETIEKEKKDLEKCKVLREREKTRKEDNKTRNIV